MDVDENDLPDALLNVYLQEAFDRTMAMSNQWPRMEAAWNVAQVPGTTSITLPPDLNIPALISVVYVDPNGGYRLAFLNHEHAEDNFAPLSNSADVKPLYFSLWAGQLYLWPRVSSVNPVSLLLRGYRQPVWDNAASTVPDLDPRLHATLAYYALSLAYAQQEDDILENSYMGRWNRDVAQQLKVMMEPQHARPLVMNGGSPVGGTPSYVVVPPPGA